MIMLFTTISDKIREKWRESVKLADYKLKSIVSLPYRKLLFREFLLVIRLLRLQREMQHQHRGKR